MVQDTAKLLWEKIFHVLVPQLSLRSIEDINAYGSYTTMDKGIDNALRNQWIPTMISIARMIELFQEGAQIRIVKESDTKEIYEIISNHLSVWESTLKTGINIGDAPVQDLIAMDAFAQILFPHARPFFNNQTLDSILGRKLAGLNAINPNNLFQSRETESDNLPERDNMSEFFKSKLTNLNR